VSGESTLLRIDEADNVAVCLRGASSGDALVLGEERLAARESVPRGHKVALEGISAGSPVIKYGYPIGVAAEDIEPGSWVHCHNLRTALRSTGEYAYRPAAPAPPEPGPEFRFDGYLRPNGEAGIRNELWIVNTVGCVNATAERIARAADEAFAGAAFGGVRHFAHPYGCSQLGEDHESTARILAGLAAHPNAGGVLVLALGCENNTLESFRERLAGADQRKFAFLKTQDVEDEIGAGLAALRGVARYAGTFERSSLPASMLRVGLKCGGSDAFSGLTANPLVGAFCDLLVARGGSAVMTEVPEMFGAETILMDRCVDEAVFRKCVAMVERFKGYFAGHGQPVYENPSPGNKEGGISTLEEKSLGCVRKAGRAPVVDVLDYGGRATRPGLSLLSGPGNDIVSVTALAAAGAHMTLFTTGRGTPLGGPVPAVKISSTSELARRKANWIDADSGPLLEGASMDSLAEDLFRRCLDLASGKSITKSEANGHHEIAIFKDGVTL
jgi:altronate hydrolase